MMRLNTLGIAHKIIAEHVQPGDLCIDATAGRGHDTAFLCELVGKEGKVLAFDIQQAAVDSTRALLAEKGMEARQAIHEVSLCYATPAQAKALDVAPGDALLCLHEVIYDQSGHPLHTSHQVIRGDRFTFRI